MPLLAGRRRRLLRPTLCHLFKKHIVENYPRLVVLLSQRSLSFNLFLDGVLCCSGYHQQYRLNSNSEFDPLALSLVIYF